MSGRLRRLAFRGPVNFRDLGGYPAAGGREVRWGLVFRSDALILDGDDADAFARLGVRTVYDLRSSPERAAKPNSLPGLLRIVDLPLVSEDPAANLLDELAGLDQTEFLRRLYTLVVERSAPTIGRLLSGLADPASLPAVFHCTAGKDRTGLVAAVLLSVLGVPREVVLDDYELTSRYRPSDHTEASLARLGDLAEIPAAMAAGRLDAPREAMAAALSLVDDRYGGFDGYLTGPAGADAAVPERLRELLVTP